MEDRSLDLEADTDFEEAAAETVADQVEVHNHFVAGSHPSAAGILDSCPAVHEIVDGLAVDKAVDNCLVVAGMVSLYVLSAQGRLHSCLEAPPCASAGRNLLGCWYGGP